MYGTLEQQNFPDPSSAPEVFASDPQAVKQRPDNLYYFGGVQVSYTAPAKWWNWLWNHISAWFRDSKTDRESVQTELSNVLSAASVIPDSSNEHQLSEAVDKVTYNTADAYNDAEEDGHKINQPYVVGHTLFIPDTELL